MITTREAAARLGVSRSRVLELIKNGQVKATKLSGVWLVDEESVAERARTVNKKGGRPARGEGRNELRFTLMNRTRELAAVVYSETRREFSFIGEPLDGKRMPIGLAQAGHPITLPAFNGWWRGRGVPGTRAGIGELLRRAGVDLPEELLQRNLGLSLSDQYWIRPHGSGLRWEDINFFGNDFGDAGERIESCRGEAGPGLAHPDNTSDGNLPKQWIARNGDRLLRKGSLHNGQEPYNEAVATALHRRLLSEGDYVAYELDGEGASAWSVCANFLTDEEEYVPALYVERLRDQPGDVNGFDHYVDCCHQLGAGKVRSALERMIVCDDIVANSDRHYRNFGIVRNVETLECRPAPIFDSGSSLWCDLGFAALSRREFGYTSKQFEPSPSRQLLLVQDFSWFDPSKLDGFVDEAMQILGANDMLEKRLPYLREGLERRVNRMIDIAEWS